MASLLVGGLCRQARSFRGLNYDCYSSLSTFSFLCVRDQIAARKMGLPRVFFDMSADSQQLGRFVVEVSKILILFSLIKCNSTI